MDVTYVFMLLRLTMDILPDMSLAVVTDLVELDKSICQTEMYEGEKNLLLKVFELVHFLCYQNYS